MKSIAVLVLLVVCIGALNGAKRRARQTDKSQFDPKKTYDFTDKVVLTTGSSSGIGAEIVKLFSQFGAKVVVTGRNATEVQRVANECEKLSPKKLKPLQVVADVSDDKQLNNLLKKTIDTYGKLDVLVNNAGMGGLTPIADPKFMTDFDKIMSVNLRPYVQLSHLAVPYLMKTNGSIISTSTGLTMSPAKYQLAYIMSKAAIDMMTRVLALELGPNIRVNSINPGLTQTGFLDPPANSNIDPAIIQGFVNFVAGRTPLKRLGQPMDMAKGVVFLASDQASFITGINLVIDGGLVHNFGGIMDNFQL
ncbi:3-oxoacyl-[acyl-carrier-protein] reductase FabG-like [Oppia nitens]|uniref:3-oxoacyl-[acyl-carrier-protein] reductase FabG-like n=1 Tax=Oppia nitens TaxID=1686743 RepID=UPI0023DBBB27|nr:3-oxoacyl-[acyl-carrier-protein] reductase FabG-like [Oppia nitens]